MFEAAISEFSKIFKSDHPLMTMARDIMDVLYLIWHHKVMVTSDNQVVRVSNIAIGVLLFFIGLKLARRLSYYVRKKIPATFDKSTANTLERISYYFFLTVITIFVIDIANLPTTVFTVVGTTVALGIGFGSQNIANNFISGLIIMIERPIKIGDIIEVKKVVGKVINVGARCVSIRTNENIVILVPNSSILQDIVINWTLEDDILQTGIILEVGNNFLIDELDKLLINSLENHDQVLKDPPPKIFLKTMGILSYKVEVWFWLSLSAHDTTKHAIDSINREFLALARANDIEIVSSSEIEHISIKES
jgi:small-conductance mechanosensitive channel